MRHPLTAAPPYALPQALSPTAATRWRLCISPEVENDDTMIMTNLFQRKNRLLGRCLQFRCKKLETEEKLCLKDCWFSKVGSGERHWQQIRLREKSLIVGRVE